MSPLAKQSQPPITDAQAWRWIKRHYEAKYDTKIDRNYGFGRYSAIAPKVGKFVADLQALQAAILDPTSPGATDVMAGVIDLIGTDGTTALGDLDSDIESYGEAIAWGLRGEPQADLDAFAEKHEQHQREYEEAKIRCSTPEFIEGCTQRWLTHCTDALINAVRGDVGSDSKQRPLTTEERAGLLESLREAFEQLAPAKADKKRKAVKR